MKKTVSLWCLAAMIVFAFSCVSTAGEDIPAAPFALPPAHQPSSMASQTTSTPNQPALPEGMVYVPAGEFMMGSDEGDRERVSSFVAINEMPRHMVNLKTFYIDKYEVTNRQYKMFLDELKAKGIKAFEYYNDDGVPVPDRWSVRWRGNLYPDGEGDYPVVDVDWYMAGKYCESLGKRLPSEEEWEKAARGTDGRAYPWGDEYAVGYSNNREYWQAMKKELRDWRAFNVGSFEKDVSPYGAYDMGGNAFEWTSSLFRPYPGSDFFIPAYNLRRYVLRGGAFNMLSHEYGRTASRASRSPTDSMAAHADWHTDMNIGFRCVRDAE